MAKSIKEIGKKAEDLIEQGNEAKQNVSNCQSRVASANASVASARRQLAAASRTDENGNPVGDVAAAQARLSMAQNQLAASQRALDNAKNEVERINRQKQSQVSEISRHNETSKHNLEKLRRLRSLSFGENANALEEGIASRINEAEDSRVRLLESMGVEANADYVDAEDTSSGSQFQGINVRSVDVSGDLWSHQGGGGGASEGISSGGRVAAPVGGGLTTGNIGLAQNDGSSINTNNSTNAPQALDNQAQQINDTSASGKVTDSSSSLNNAYERLVNKIIESDTLSAERKIAELDSIKSQLMAISQNYPTEIEAPAIKKLVLSKKLSAEEKRQMGERYIDNMLEGYRDELLDRGATSLPAIDTALSELKQQYTNELEKDIQGLPNDLYTDPDYDALMKKIDENRPAIAGVKPGQRMEFWAADSGHVNPDYGTDIGFSTNCQSSVVVFEARQRGYPAKVLANKQGSMLEKLSYDPSLAWIDPRTGKHPDYIYNNSLKNADDYLKFVNSKVQPGHRYTIQFLWKGRNKGGHIVNLDRTPDGLLRIKDNQRGLGERSDWVGDEEVKEYLSSMKYEKKCIFGPNIPCVPKILQIDNMDFDYSVVNQIMIGA